LRLLKLPSEIQRLLEEEVISMGHARALLSIESAEQQRALAEEISSKTLSVRETERLIKRVQGQRKETDQARSVGQDIPGESANILAAESKLSKRLAAPVKIKFLQAGGVVEIRFSSSEDLMRIFDLLVQNNSL
jgi:ParB family chromosome partitioning protein